MGFFKDLFGPTKKRDARESTNEELDEILAPIRERVADFKDRTKLSFTYILPAINSVGVKLLVKSRGLESAQRLYRAMINNLDSKGGIPVGAHLDISQQPVAPEDIAELNSMLWEHANDAIAQGKPIEHVAQAYTSFAMLLAERAASGDQWLAKYLLAQAARELKIDFKELGGAQAEPPLHSPGDLGEPVNMLFEHFRDLTLKFKEASGLEWEHLLPGLQMASTACLIKDRGKASTIEFFEQQIENLQSSLSGPPGEFPYSVPTPSQVANMAKFNEFILRSAVGFAAHPDCHPRYVGFALSMLVISISTTHFDLIRAMAAFAASCEEIKEGRYDQYDQLGDDS